MGLAPRGRPVRGPQPAASSQPAQHDSTQHGSTAQLCCDCAVWCCAVLCCAQPQGAARQLPRYQATAAYAAPSVRMLPVLLPSTMAVALTVTLAAPHATAKFVHPPWDMEMEMGSTTACVEVPVSAASNFSGNSRWAFTQLPKGSPPEGGWPVLIQLAIIPFQAVGEKPLYPNGTRPSCGLDGYNPPHFPWGPEAASADSEGLLQVRDYTGNRRKRQQRAQQRGFAMPAASMVDEHLERLQLLLPETAPERGPGPGQPNYWGCIGAMAQTLGVTSWWRTPTMTDAQTQYCLRAVNGTKPGLGPILPFLMQHGCTAEFIQRGCSPASPTCSEISTIANGNPRCLGYRTNCTATQGADECTAQPCPQPGPCAMCENLCGMRNPATVELNCSFSMLSDGCGDHRHDGMFQPRYMMEDFSPFVSPPKLMEPCTCFHKNGTYSCPTRKDHGNHSKLASPRALLAGPPTT
jgi:hypothetical protein